MRGTKTEDIENAVYDLKALTPRGKEMPDPVCPYHLRTNGTWSLPRPTNGR